VIGRRAVQLTAYFTITAASSMYKNLTLLGISTLVSLVALEFALRLIMPERLAFVPILQNNALTYVPHQQQRARHLEWDYVIDVNADGFRNDRNLEDIPDRTILALGDSFTEGYGVSLEKSFPKQFEDVLAVANPDIHVYNAGHAGTGIPYYRLVYREIFKHDRRIDRVLIAFYVGNDLLHTDALPNGNLRPGNEYGNAWTYKLKVFLGTRVALYAVANWIIKSNPAFDGMCKKLGACDEPPPPVIYRESIAENAIPKTLAHLISFVNEIRADGRQAVVLIIPTREQIDNRQWQRVVEEFGKEVQSRRLIINRGLTEGLKNSGIDVLDLTDVARKQESKNPGTLYFEHDGHWTEVGHIMAAAALSELNSLK
jgi:lysophospholipase L1-like esterase